MIRKLKKTDDLKKVAEIVYQTDAFLFPFLFGKKEKAILRIEKLIALEDNVFSYKNIYVDIDNEPRGILVEEKAKIKYKNSADFSKSFSIMFLMGLLVKQLLIFPLMLHQLKEGETYLQIVCVDKNHRGQGIGSALLKNAVKRAKQEGINTLFLDVAITNYGARKLYEKHGFEIVKKKIVWWIFPVTYWMKKTIKD